MSEHHDHTEFLKHCLRYDDSSERHVMMEKLTRLQRELYVIKRASLLVGILIGGTAGALSDPDVLVQDLSFNVQQFVMNIVLAVFGGLSICLLTFIALGIVLYQRLHRQREACRQLLMRLLASRLNSAQQR